MKMTVESALRKVRDMNINWTINSWMDNPNEPTRACILGAIAIACTDGEVMDIEEDVKMQTAETVESFKADDARWAASYEADRVTMGRRHTFFQENPNGGHAPASCETSKFSDLTPDEVETTKLFIEAEIREHLEDYDIGQAVTDLIGVKAFDELEFVPGWNDDELTTILRDRFYLRHGDYTRPQLHLQRSLVTTTQEDVEIASTMDSLAKSFMEYINSYDVWDEIIEVLREKAPEVMGLEVCNTEGCDDC